LIKYLSCRPGITGLWQVSGRNNVGYSDRVQLDCTYIANWSFMLDCKIILRTFRAVLSRRGAY
jgi:lipopolysaccharide/colanic/teichoic acid biosynthesis glycosyltransferase